MEAKQGETGPRQPMGHRTEVAQAQGIPPEL